MRGSRKRGNRNIPNSPSRENDVVSSRGIIISPSIGRENLFEKFEVPYILLHLEHLQERYKSGSRIEQAGSQGIKELEKPECHGKLIGA